MFYFLIRKILLCVYEYFIVELSRNWHKITTFLFYYITRRFHMEKKIIVCLQKQVKQNSRIKFTNYLDFLMKQKTGIP